MSDKLSRELEATLNEFAVEVYKENFKLKARNKALEGNRAKLIKNLESGIIKNENRLSICEKNSSDAAFCQGIISNCKFIISLLEEV